MQDILKKNFSRETLNTGKFERVPPYNIEAEESLLGSMIISKDAIGSVLEIVKEDDFYRKSSSDIFKSINEMYSKGEPVDSITLADYLKKKDLLEETGGKAYIHSLLSNIPLASNATYYAEIVKHNSILRKLIYAATDIAKMGYEVPDDIDTAVDKAQQLIFMISQDLNYGSRNSTFIQIKEVLEEVYDQTVLLSEKKTSITGITTGFIDLDKMTSGLQQSDLIILAARPSMGKTSLALCMLKNASINNTPVAIFSLEMSKQQIAQRLLCSESKIDLNRIRSGDLREHEWPKLGHAIEKLSENKIFIDDAPILTVMELRARARMLVSNFGVKFIVIDYLQLMQSGTNYRENRVLEITDISRNLKSLARELKIPVLAVSQLSREVEKRPDKRPILADLRESGAIEQDADLVMFIYRDEYYEKENTKFPGTAEVHIAKHRNGPTGKVDLKFSKEYALFLNLDKTHSEDSKN